MRTLHFRKCVKLLDREYSGYRTDRKALAKALGVRIRSIGRYRQEIRRARDLELYGPCPALPLRKRRGGPAPPRVAPDSPAPEDSQVRHHRLARKDLAHLARCDGILRLEYSGYQGSVRELAEMLNVSQRMLYRDLALIEAVRGSPVKLVPRRKKRTK